MLGTGLCHHRDVLLLRKPAMQNAMFIKQPQPVQRAVGCCSVVQRTNGLMSAACCLINAGERTEIKSTHLLTSSAEQCACGKERIGML
ncbi:MAG: hypothetical protein SGPRY_003910 [Prymnesium sp.]